MQVCSILPYCLGEYQEMMMKKDFVIGSIKDSIPLGGVGTLVIN